MRRIHLFLLAVTLCVCHGIKTSTRNHQLVKKKPSNSHSLWNPVSRTETERKNIFDLVRPALLSVAMSSLLSFSQPAIAQDVGLFPIKTSTDSELLKTTIRPSPSVSVPKKENYLKVFFEEGLQRLSTSPTVTPNEIVPLDLEGLKRMVFVYPDNFNFLVGLFGVLFFRAATFSKSDLRDKLEDTKEQVLALKEEGKKRQELLDQEKSAFSNLQVESQRILGDVGALSQQLMEKSEEVTQLSSTIEELRQQSLSIEAHDTKLIATLQTEAEEWKIKTELLSSELLALQVTNAEDAKQVLVTRKDTEDQLLQSLQKMLVRLDLLPQGIANMMLPSSASQIMDGITLPEVTAPVIEESIPAPDDPVLVSKIAELTATMNKLNTENEKLKESSKSLSEKFVTATAEAKAVKVKVEPTFTEAPIEAPAAKASPAATKKENELLKVEITKNTEVYTRVTNEMNQKLDAAKSMTKELNSQLMAKEQELGARELKLSTTLKSKETANEVLQKELDETKALLEKSLEAAILAAQMEASIPEKKKGKPKKSKFPDDGLQLSKEELVASLKALKPYQIRSMTKKKLESLLITLDVPLERQLAKTELFALLEGCLEE